MIDRHVSTFLAVLIVEFFRLNYSAHYSLIDVKGGGINCACIVGGQCVAGVSQR